MGKDEHEAQRRYDQIQKLYLESEAIRKHYGIEPCWTEAALHAANHIRRGLTHIPIPSPHVVNEASGEKYHIGEYNPDWEGIEPYAMIWSHAVASRHYPSVNWILPDASHGQNAMELGQKMYDIQARRQSKLSKAEPPKNPVVGVLYEALDRYVIYIETEVSKGIEPGSTFKRIDQVKAIKRHQEDIPLSRLDLHECQSIFSYWKNRPVMDKETQERYKPTTCGHRINELSAFFNWLHKTNEFGWRKPDDYDLIDKSVVRDRKKKSIRTLVTKPTYDISQLQKLNAKCGKLERLLLYLGLNCSFGAAESGRLEFEDVFLHQENPLSHCWKNYGFKSDKSDSWIAFLRPKTNVAGCWWLWPETVDALEMWLKERPAASSQRLLITSRGNTLYRDHTKNAQSGFQKLWTNLTNELRKVNPGFPKLPFGTLRDQFPDWSVFKGEAESGSMSLAHGTPFKDDLLECYANRPFPRLFELQKHNEKN